MRFRHILSLLPAISVSVRALFAVSSLSQASVAELSVLLRSMEESRKAKVTSTGAQTSDNAVPESKTRLPGDAKRAAAAPTRKLSSSSSSISSSKLRNPNTSDDLVNENDTTSLSASLRPDLREFKKQQQEALRRTKEAEFFKLKGIMPLVMAGDLDSQPSRSNFKSQKPVERDGIRDRDRDRSSMPPVELYLKAPNSDGILRAALSGNGDEMRYQSHDSSYTNGESSDNSTAARILRKTESTMLATSRDGILQAPFPYTVSGGDKNKQQYRQNEVSSNREGMKPTATA